MSISWTDPGSSQCCTLLPLLLEEGDEDTFSDESRECCLGGLGLRTKVEESNFRSDSVDCFLTFSGWPLLPTFSLPRRRSTESGDVDGPRSSRDPAFDGDEREEELPDDGALAEAGEVGSGMREEETAGDTVGSSRDTEVLRRRLFGSGILLPAVAMAGDGIFRWFVHFTI